MIQPFRLYGLPGCAHCIKADTFLHEKNIPYEAIVATGDPIVAAGVRAVTNKEDYPVLFSRLTNEVIVGYKPEDYERIQKIWEVLLRTGSVEGAPPPPAAPTPSCC